MDSTKERCLNQQECAIAVMAKRPDPGNVKTRLCPPLYPQQAADLSKAFFLDTVSLVGGLEDVEVFVAYDPGTARDYFSLTTPDPVICIPQGTGDLGARLLRISSELFLGGYRKLVILASDTPHLPPEVIRRAFDRLDEVDAVLGPCDDGGYYLIGTRSFVPSLFEKIPWSTSRVLDRTIGRACDAGITWELLPPCYDIDTWEDAQRLIKDLRTGAAGTMERCVKTREALAGLACEGIVPLRS